MSKYRICIQTAFDLESGREKNDCKKGLEQRGGNCETRYNVPSRGRETGSTLTTDLQGCLKLQQDGLTEEDLPGFDTQAPHLCLGHLDDLPRAASSDWQRENLLLTFVV